MIVFVSRSEADYRTLRQMAGRMSQSVVRFPDVEQARSAISRHHPEIVICETHVPESGSWRELLEDVQEAQAVLLVVSQHADERLWAEVLNLGGFDVLTLPFEPVELTLALSSALRHSPRVSAAAVTL